MKKKYLVYYSIRGEAVAEIEAGSLDEAKEKGKNFDLGDSDIEMNEWEPEDYIYAEENEWRRRSYWDLRRALWEVS